MLEDAFTAIGAVILIGFMGRYAYRRTHVPESIVMIAIGLLLGPVLGLISQDALIPFVPFLSILALVLVLLDAGLELNVFKLFKEFPSALLFTFCVAIISTILIGSVVHLVFGWGLVSAFLLGLIASGTTTVAAMTLLDMMKVREGLKNFIFLETVINDFILVSGTGLILLLSTDSVIDGHGIVSEVASGISIALFLGLTTGYMWMRLLGKMDEIKLNYISSIGILFLLFGLTEAVGGDGILSVIFFSLFLGNYPNIHKRFDNKAKRIEIDSEELMIKNIRLMHSNISFAVRIFFFVLIGLVFDFSNLTLQTAGIAVIAILLILISRYASLKILSFTGKRYDKNSFIVVTMIPRGFVATVLAFIPLSQGLRIPLLTEVVLLLVLLSNLVAILSAVCCEKSK
jgi:cell volume regulation protein A